LNAQNTFWQSQIALSASDAASGQCYNPFVPTPLVGPNDLQALQQALQHQQQSLHQQLQSFLLMQSNTFQRHTDHEDKEIIQIPLGVNNW